VFQILAGFACLGAVSSLVIATGMLSRVDLLDVQHISLIRSMSYSLVGLLALQISRSVTK
jgi:hypothetical protein